VAGDFSNGRESASLSERKKVNLNKSNFAPELSEYSPAEGDAFHAQSVSRFKSESAV